MKFKFTGKKRKECIKMKIFDWICDYLPINIWRFMASIGTIFFVSTSTLMHLYGWFLNNQYWTTKAISGLKWSFLYFIVVLILKYMKTINLEKIKSNDNKNTFALIAIVFSFIFIIFWVVVITHLNNVL